MVGHLLAWEMHEHDGTWHAWVSWIQPAGGRHVHKVVDVRAGSLQPLEPPDAYSAVPRRVRGSDGLIRPWSGESGLGGRDRRRRRHPGDHSDLTRARHVSLAGTWMTMIRSGCSTRRSWNICSVISPACG
jgi:hypothetical protein